MRKEKNGNRYFSFNELAQDVFNLRPRDPHEFKNLNKKDEVQKGFEKRHMCNNCHTPLTYIGGNVMCCKNPECTKQGYHTLAEREKNLAISLYRNEVAE